MLASRYRVEYGLAPSGFTKEHLQANTELFGTKVRTFQTWDKVQNLFYEFDEKVCKHELVKQKSELQKVKDGDSFKNCFAYEQVRELRKDKKSDTYRYTVPRDAFAFFLVTNIHTKAQRGLAWCFLDRPHPEQYKGLPWFRYVWFGTADF